MAISKVKQKRLDENLKVLREHFTTDKFQYMFSRVGLVILGVRPVVVKAMLEKLMREGKMTRGTVMQWADCVIYEPTGYIKFYDEKFPA